MAKTREQKRAAVAEYVEKIQASEALLFVRPEGISANQAVEIKKALSGINSNFNVVKNTLFKLALEEVDLPEIAELDDGPNAVVFCGEDIAAAAKLLKEFSANLEDKLSTTVGIMDGVMLSREQVVEIADMPSQEVIMAQIAGIMTDAVGGVSNVLQDSVRSIAFVVGEAFQEE